MAASTYFDAIQKIYIAFYQRPADPAGLYYWAQRADAAGGDLSAVINAFASSEEAGRLYGTIDATTIGDVIDKVYQALFNRAPDDAGKQFYIDGFNDGTFTPGTIVLNILDGAQNDDALAITNKLEVANLFTKALDPEQNGIPPFTATYNADDESNARSLLASVTSDPATRKTEAAVKADIQTKIANPGDSILSQGTDQTFTLTTGVDYADTTTAFLNGGAVTSTFKFTSSNETVNAGGGTFSSTDILVDNTTTDNDVLNATLTGSAPIAANLTNIETLKLNLAGNGAGLDFAGITGAKTVEVSGIQNGVLSNVAATAPEVTLTGGYDKTLTVAFDTLAGTSSSNPETLKVNLNGAGSKAAVQINIEGTVSNGSLEQLTINSAGTAANTLSVGTSDFDGTSSTSYASANGISKFTVTGTQDLTLNVKHATISTKTLENTGSGKLTLDVDRGKASTQVTSLAQATGYQNLVLRGEGDVNVSGIVNGATVTLVDSFTGTSSDSLSVKGAASGQNDSLTLVLDHKDDAKNLTFNAAFAVNDIETVSIQSKGGDSTGHQLGDTSSTGGFEANAAKTINISGDTKLTLNLDTDTKFETLNIEGTGKHAIDFVGAGTVGYGSGKNVTVNSTSTSDLTLDLSQIVLDAGASTTETLSVTTGSGKDTLAFGQTLEGSKLVVDAGDGDNTIVVMGDGTGSNNIKGEVSITNGTGKDTIVFGPDSAAANSSLETSSAKVTITTGAGDDVVKLGNVTKNGSTVDLGDGGDKVYVGITATGTSPITNDVIITTGAGADTVYLYAPDGATSTGQEQKITITDFTAGTGGDVLNLTGWVGTGFATSVASANTNGQAALTNTASAEKGLFKLGAFDAAKITNGTGTDVAFNIGAGANNDTAIAVLFNNNTGLTEVWIAYDADGTGNGTDVVVEKIATLENITLTGIADLKIENFSFS